VLARFFDRVLIFGGIGRSWAEFARGTIVGTGAIRVSGRGEKLCGATGAIGEASRVSCRI